MPLNDNALTDLAAVKRRVGIAVGDTSLDEHLIDYINEVSQTVENIIGRPLKAADMIEYLEASDEQFLLVKRYPINTVSEIVYINSNRDDQTLIENEDWFVRDPLQGSIYRPYGWFREGYSRYLGGKVEFVERSIKVTYNGGYEVIPADITGVVKDIIGDNLSLEDAQGLKSYSISDVKWVWDKSFSTRQLKTLKYYKSLRF